MTRQILGTSGCITRFIGFNHKRTRIVGTFFFTKRGRGVISALHFAFIIEIDIRCCHIIFFSERCRANWQLD